MYGKGDFMNKQQLASKIWESANKSLLTEIGWNVILSVTIETLSISGRNPDPDNHRLHASLSLSHIVKAFQLPLVGDVLWQWSYGHRRDKRAYPLIVLYSGMAIHLGTTMSTMTAGRKHDQFLHLCKIKHEHVLLLLIWAAAFSMRHARVFV